jgi:hypothetical protein
MAEEQPADSVGRDVFILMWCCYDVYDGDDTIVDVFSSNEEAHVLLDYLKEIDAMGDEEETSEYDSTGHYVITSRRLYRTGKEAIDDHRSVYGTP